MELIQLGLRKSLLPEAASNLQRQELNSIRNLFRVQRLGGYFEFLYYLTDVQAQLMYIEEAGKLDTLPLKTGSQSEQIRILTEEHSAQFGCPLQELFVVKSRRTVFARSQNVNASKAKATGYGPLYVMIHV